MPAQLIKSNSASDDTRESDPQLLALTKLWEKIEKHEKRNERLRDKMDQLFAEFNQQVLPYEHKQSQQVARQIIHLTKFIDKKSLSHEQRAELFAWIESEIAYLESHPFAEGINTAEMRESLDKAIGDFSRANPITLTPEIKLDMRDMLDDMFAGQLDLSDEQLQAIVEDPAVLQQFVQEQLGEQAEDEYTDENDDFFADHEFEDFFHHHDHREKAAQRKDSQLNQLFKSSQLNKMYKRLATQLHPDKEMDPLKKAEKHQLMQTLSLARKNKDAFALLKLYQQYVPDADFSFDPQTLTAMEQLLKQKVVGLNQDHQKLKQSNELPALVWRKLSARSKKMTKANIEQHIVALDKEYADSQAFIRQHSTVKMVGKLLSQRIKQKSFEVFSFGGAMSEMFDMDN